MGNKRQQDRPLFVSVYDSEQEALRRVEEIRKRREELLKEAKDRKDNKGESE